MPCIWPRVCRLRSIRPPPSSSVVACDGWEPPTLTPRHVEAHAQTRASTETEMDIEIEASQKRESPGRCAKAKGRRPGPANT
eukprot:scaffold28120_cov146-Isochrysis_galbana.AAC.1